MAKEGKIENGEGHDDKTKTDDQHVSYGQSTLGSTTDLPRIQNDLQSNRTSPCYSDMTKYVVLGTTGNVGSAVVRALHGEGSEVIAVVHDGVKSEHLREPGVRTVVIDIHDSDALRDVFGVADRAFLLNPPAAPDTDTDREGRPTVAAILEPSMDPAWTRLSPLRPMAHSQVDRSETCPSSTTLRKALSPIYPGGY